MTRALRRRDPSTGVVGGRIGLVTLPFLVVGVVLNIASPSLFTIGGPPPWLGVLSVLVLLVGVVIWAWCVYLLLTNVPRRELITNGPYAVVKHPLYTGAALLVLPWLGFLLNTWLGAAIGIVLYVASRVFASPRRWSWRRRSAASGTPTPPRSDCRGSEPDLARHAHQVTERSAWPESAALDLAGARPSRHARYSRYSAHARPGE